MIQDFNELKTKIIQTWEGADIKLKCTHFMIQQNYKILQFKYESRFEFFN